MKFRLNKYFLESIGDLCYSTRSDFIEVKSLYEFKPTVRLFVTELLLKRYLNIISHLETKEKKILGGEKKP